MATSTAIKLHDFEEYVKSVHENSFVDDESRFRASLAARSLVNRLESPYETFKRRAWIEPALDVALKIGIDIGLFEALSKDDEQPKSTEVLAQATGVNDAIVKRVCRHLAAMEAIGETEADTYSATRYSNSLIDQSRQAGVNQLFDGYIYGLRALPRWLKEHNYQLPSNERNAPWQLGTGEKKTFFEWLGARPERSQDFNMMMVGVESEWKSPMDLYPVQERLLRDFRGGVLFVDVGGGLGQDLKRFQQKYPVPEAQYILQDLQHVVSEAVVDAPIEKMAYDFFAEQPVKGARTYFLKQVCHDWPDDKAIEILKNISTAMEPGYTKLLIHEIVIPYTGASPHATGVDLTMMSLFGSKERVESDWRQVIEAAGLKLENIWGDPGYRESVLEVVRLE